MKRSILERAAPPVGQEVRAVSGPGGGVGIQRLDAETSVVFGSESLSPPAAFGWAPPIRVWRQNGVLMHDFSPDDWIVPTTATFWVDVNGNDSTGNGAYATPYRSVGKAIESMAGPTTIYVRAGIYDRNRTWGDKSPAHDCNIIAIGGPVVTSARWENNGPYTLTTNNTYEFSRSTVCSVVDRKIINARGTAQVLKKVATQALCEAEAGTWATNGTLCWVHLSDERVPDALVTPLLSVTQGYMTNPVRIFVRGIAIEGGSYGCFRTENALLTENARAVFDRCEFLYAASNIGDGMVNGVALSGLPLAIFHKCRASGNAADGFNYHRGATNNLPTRVIEIDCVSMDNGRTDDGINNDNASTLHGDCRGVRIRTYGAGCVGPTFIDIDDSRSWNIDCQDDGSVSTGANSNAGYYVSHNAVQWLDHCQSRGSNNPVFVSGSSAQQFQRLGTLPVPATY
mgnify:CR=1 FL=1